MMSYETLSLVAGVLIAALFVLNSKMPKLLEASYRRRRNRVPKFKNVWDESRYLRTLSHKGRDRYYSDKWCGLNRATLVRQSARRLEKLLDDMPES